MSNKKVSIKSADGKSFAAYASLPANGSGPGVVVIQEIFGVNKWLRSVCDLLAENGYVAVAPDLFHRMEPNVELGYSDEDFKKAFDFYGRFDVEAGLKDLYATVDFVRAMDECTGKVGTMGFCLGGRMSFLMSTRSNAEANAGYYGVAIEGDLGESVQQPLLLHFAEADKHVLPEAVEKIRTKLADNDKVTIYTYPGLDHAFCREEGSSYDAAACKLAHSRTLDFFQRHLA